MELSLAGLPFPIIVRPPVPLSDEELLLFCESNEIMRVELEPNGDLTVMTLAGTGSGNLNGYLTMQIGNWSEADGRGEFFDSSAGFKLPDGAMRNPDAAWISHERIAALARSRSEASGRSVPSSSLNWFRNTTRAARSKRRCGCGSATACSLHG